MTELAKMEPAEIHYFNRLNLLPYEDRENMADYS